MGSFDFTCAVSGLPIGGGTEVRYCLLQSSPFGASGNYADGELSWYMRALPIRAAYNDYGTVEDVDPLDATIQQNWLEGLQLDLVEKGWGDNTCHDVPTRREMTFDELREALWENRAEVRAELKEHDPIQWSKLLGRKKPKISRGIPTMRRIEKAILKSGSFTYTVDANHVVQGPGGRYTYTPPKEEKNYSAKYDPHTGFGCGESVTDSWRLDARAIGNAEHALIVDELQRGEVRVRCGGYNSAIEETMRLSHLAKRLRRRYSVMLSPGEFGHAQLIVHPKPGTKDGEYLFSFHKRASDKAKPKTLHLAVAMVREDVWQALCGMSSEYWDEKYNTVNATLDAYRKLARDAWEAYQKKYSPSALKRDGDDETQAFLRRLTHDWKSYGHKTHNPIAWFTGENPSIGGFGMDTTWKIFADGERTPSEVESFLEATAQTALVCNVLRTVRFAWRPSSSNGPQCGEWEEHATFLQKLANIAKQECDRREKD